MWEALGSIPSTVKKKRILPQEYELIHNKLSKRQYDNSYQNLKNFAMNTIYISIKVFEKLKDDEM
jgi:hypothetical protein